MTATEKNATLADRLNRRGMNATLDDAATLRRAESTLRRWAEGECGGSNDAGSYSIERDETTGKPFRHFYGYSGSHFKSAIPDRERGALATVANLCTAKGWHFFHQTDPRGASLYVSADPLTDTAYTNGVCCHV